MTMAPFAGETLTYLAKAVVAQYSAKPAAIIALVVTQMTAAPAGVMSTHM